jgi:hypothetical protein
VVRSWIRQALRASGVAILVPAAVVAAIALSVVGGGGGVGSLGDVLNGPAVPPAEAAAQPAAQPRRDETPRARAAAAGSPIAAPPTAPPRRRGARAPLIRRPVTTLPLPSRRPAGPPAGPPAAQPTAPPAPASSGQPPPAQPRPIHDTGAQLAQTVRPLPVAGPVAADAVQAVVDLVDPPA